MSALKPALLFVPLVLAAQAHAIPRANPLDSTVNRDFQPVAFSLKVSPPKLSLPKISPPKINPPKLDLPKLPNLPKIDVPKVDLGRVFQGLAGGSGGVNPSVPSRSNSNPGSSQGPIDTRTDMPAKPLTIPLGKDVEDALDITKLPGRVEQFFDAMQDVVSGGAHGRKRDSDRAAEAERLSKATRQGAENTAAEKKKGLQDQLTLAQSVEKNLREMQQEYNLIMGYLPNVLVFAKNVMANQIVIDDSLKHAQQGQRDAAQGLQLFLITLRGTKPGDPRAWSDAYLKLQDFLKGTDEEVDHYLNRAIVAASAQDLKEFVDRLASFSTDLNAMGVQLETGLQDILQKEKSLQEQLDAMK